MSFVCSLPVIGLLFDMCLAPAPLATGYVEGDYILVAPIETARISELSVARGDRVSEGDLLVTLEHRDAEISLAEANAAIAQAKSNLANLNQGARPEKIATLEATLAAAQFSATEAKRDLERQRQLMERGSVARSVFDTAKTSYDVAEAKVKELEANLAYTRLPARKDEIAAAQAAVEQAQAARESAQWRLEQRTLTASQSGIIVDIIRDNGEVAGPSAPVLSILPDDGTKLRLYVPEVDIATVQIGSQLSVECDACGTNLKARVSYISDGPEFTPPVIYSLENRQKLVYLIEAVPSAGTNLKPGQIVSVRIENRSTGAK